MLISSFGAGPQALRPRTVPPDRPGIAHCDPESPQEEGHILVHDRQVDLDEPPREFHNGRM